MSGGFRKRIQSPYFGSGNPETEELTTLYAPGMLGCIAEYDQGTPGAENVCTYQLVKLAAALQGLVGQVLYWSTAALKGLYTVTATATNTGSLAGIAQRATTTAATYIWMLKHGYRSVLLIDAPTSAADTTGKPVVAVTATAGKADVLALATAPQPMLIGQCMTAQDGTSKLATCFVNIPDYL